MGHAAKIYGLLKHRFSSPPSQKLIKNPDFLSGTYRAWATIRNVVNILSFPHPTFPLPLPVAERKEARGEVRAASRSAVQTLKPLPLILSEYSDTHLVITLDTLTIRWWFAQSRSLLKSVCQSDQHRFRPRRTDEVDRNRQTECHTCRHGYHRITSTGSE